MPEDFGRVPTQSEVDAFFKAHPDAKKPKAESDESVSLHEDYARGSTTFDLATWTHAVQKMLGETRTRHPLEATERVEVRAGHPTAPKPDFWSPSPRVRKPTATLPELVEETALEKGARTEEQEGSMALPVADLDAALYGAAHHLVSHARLRQAKGIVLRAPRVEAGRVFYETVLVL